MCPHMLMNASVARKLCGLFTLGATFVLTRNGVGMESVPDNDQTILGTLTKIDREIWDRYKDFSFELNMYLIIITNNNYSFKLALENLCISFLPNCPP